MSAPLVVSVDVRAVQHLAAVVLQHLALAELEAGPDAVSWPEVRDRALEQIQAQALAGDERAAATWSGLISASYDVEFVQLVARLEEPEEGADG